MVKDKKVRADLHVHVDGGITEENVIKVLKKAQKDGCKKLCVLEHSKLNVLSVLVPLLERGMVNKYFRGSLIIGCEYDTMIDAHFTNPDGSCYDNYISHILVYMPLEDAIKINKNKVLHARDEKADYKADYEQVVAKIKQLPNAKMLQIPTMAELVEQKVEHVGKDLQAWIVADKNRKEQYMKALNIDESVIDYPGPFVRRMTQMPDAPLFYSPVYVSKCSTLFEIIRKNVKSAYIVLAHPAYMQTEFNTQYYLNTMMSYQDKMKIKIFDGIEPRYYLNTKAEEDFLINYAKERNFIMTAGSDSIKVDGMMWFIRDGKKFYFTPTLGNALGTSYDLGKVQIVKEGDKQVLKVVDGGSPLVVDAELFENIKVDYKKWIKK